MNNEIETWNQLVLNTHKSDAPTSTDILSMHPLNTRRAHDNCIQSTPLPEQITFKNCVHGAHVARTQAHSFMNH